MRTIKKLAAIFVRAFGPLIVIVGVVMGAVAWLADINGSVGSANALFSITWDQLYKLGILTIAVGCVAMILHHDWILHEMEHLSGNEHAQSLWKDGIPVTRDTYYGYVVRGDFPIVNRFWKAGISGGKDYQGRSDLHLACLYGHPAIAQELLRNGADPTATTSDGHTAFMMAALGGHVRILDMLFDHKCGPDAGTLKGCAAMYLAASQGHTAAVEKLVALGVNIDHADNANLTPLMVALSQRHYEIARILLKSGSDVKRRDASGATLMDYAKAFQAPADIVARLEAHGITVSDQNLISRSQGKDYTGHVRIGSDATELANV